MSKKKIHAGRPRIRPEVGGGVRVPLSNAMREAVKKKAKAAGLSAAQWMVEVLERAARA